MDKIKKQDWVDGYLISYDEDAKHEITYYLPHWESHTFDIMVRMQAFWRNYFMDEKPRIYCEIDIDETRLICISINIADAGIRCAEYFSFRCEQPSKYAGTNIARIFNIQRGETAAMFKNEMDILFEKFYHFLIQQFIADKTKEWKAAKP